MDWSSGVYNKPVAIIVALDPSICHHNKHQRAGSCGVLEKNSFSCCDVRGIQKCTVALFTG